ncbi:MAG TPA: M43 family zinc metalloprotease [Cyclobacteriaceae bacterium]
MARIFTLILPCKRELCLSFAFLLFLFISGYAQDRCGTVEYTNKLIKNLRHEKEDRFENWLTKKIIAHQQLLKTERTQSTTYQIPVVVHIIHNGESVGVGTNISDAQIISQIGVLNTDFNRLNKDTVLTPTEFQSVAGKMNIEFVLARQTPEGQATTGIVRVQGTQSSWTYGNDATLKALSYWPAEDYFNLWVCNLTDYLGYTQFPVSNLPGLENSPDNRLTDGVVIGYTYFGTTDAGAFNLTKRYDKGRTVTHEVGHFFGLRHIWGDDGGACNDSGDYVDDTPDQGDNTNGCPSGIRTSCNDNNMYQNYLDYTDDACMNMFTADQVTRMTTVLENCIRRTSLLTSHGLFDPMPKANDLALSKIISPVSAVCSSTVTPSLQIKNPGNNVITAAQIQLTVNSIVTETKDFALNLNVGDSVIVNFTQQLLTEGNSTFEFEILQTNNTTDGNAYNNNISITTLYSTPVASPFEETFSSLPSNWIISNPDSQLTWQIQSAPNGHIGNTAMLLNYYNYTALSASDALISPPIDLSGQTQAFLLFDLAYAARFQSNADTLRVVLLTDCNTDISAGTEIYTKAGTALATALPTNLFYAPTTESDWSTEVIDITAFKDQSNIRVAFVGTNMNGNNIYIDNVQVVNDIYSDLSLERINNPALLTCATTTPDLTVKNVGTSTITSFTVKNDVNGNTQPDKVVSGIQLSPGEKYDVTLESLSLSATSSTINFSVSNVNNNDTPDVNNANDQKTVTVVSNINSRIIPIRENLNSGIPVTWSSITPGNGQVWTSIEVDSDHKKAVYVNDFGNDNLGEQAWLISPLLDFSYATSASVFFDQSYAVNESSVDELRVLASTGCGNSFDQVLYDKGYDLSSVTTTVSWKPTQSSDWTRESINLDDLAGKKDVRLAFVMTNQNGNNLYLDNIEFYASDNTDPAQIPGKFAVYKNSNSNVDFTVTFKLDEQQTAIIDVVDLLGRVVYSKAYEYTLNQSDDVTLDDPSSGLYIVKLRTKEGSYTQKVFVTK